jgi:hypothetical protein
MCKCQTCKGQACVCKECENKDKCLYFYTLDCRWDEIGGKRNV